MKRQIDRHPYWHSRLHPTASANSMSSDDLNLFGQVAEAGCHVSPRVALPNHMVKAAGQSLGIGVLPRPSRATAPQPEKKAWMQSLSQERKYSLGATRVALQDFEQKLGPIFAASPNLKQWMLDKGLDLELVMCNFARCTVTDIKQNVAVGSQMEWMCEQLAQQITKNQELKMRIAILEDAFLHGNIADG